MKRILLFLSIIALASCSEHKQDSNTANSPIPQENAKNAIKADDTLQSIIDANINKQPVIDSIFLGFTFGMTQMQAMVHFNQLIKEHKLVKDGESVVYPMVFEVAKAKAMIAPEFENDKLYKLTLIITPADEIATQKTVFLETATAYMKKYDSSFKLFQEANIIDSSEKNYHWIKNNLHISLHAGVDGTMLSYIDMPVQKLVDKKKSTQTDSSKAQTNKDI